MGYLSRRQFLASTASAGMLGAAPSLLISSRPPLAMPATTIRVSTRVIEVNGRPATVFSPTQPDGSHGLITEVGKSFRVKLENQLDDETLIHWHGLTPPWRQDGVPNLSQAPLAPGVAYDYDFTLERPGTNWMHSHHGLQEQRLMAAPLIVRDPTEASVDPGGRCPVPRLHIPRSGRNSRRIEGTLRPDGRDGSFRHGSRCPCRRAWRAGRDRLRGWDRRKCPRNPRAHLRGFGFLGLHLDENRNAAGMPVISADQGHVQVRVIRTDEDVIITKAVFRMRAGTENKPARPNLGISL